MKFSIQCESCLDTIMVWDGHKNDDRIKINIVGESLIEIKCSCTDSVVIHDGELI